jgi:hypothetical protein
MDTEVSWDGGSAYSASVYLIQEAWGTAGISSSAWVEFTDVDYVDFSGAYQTDVLHLDFGLAPTTASWASGVVTADYIAGRPIQTVEVNASVTEVNIVSPIGINGYSLVFTTDRITSSLFNVPLSTFQTTTGGGGTFVWPAGIPDSFDVGYSGVDYFEVLVTMEYHGSNLWYCSYTTMTRSGIA